MHERSPRDASVALARRPGDFASRGRSLRAWMRANKKRAPKMLETVAKLARADKLRVEHTEYELSSEFAEAIEHAAEDARGTKIILRVEDAGSTLRE